MIEFFDSEISISNSDVDELEATYNVKLPTLYRDHLLQHNGGRCRPKTFTFIENGQESSSEIDWFLALYKGEFDNLIKYIQMYKIDEQRLPERLFPIAHDSGGNLICISCGGSDFGYIYFWDHEKEVGLDSNVFLLEKSLIDFLNNLH